MRIGDEILKVNGLGMGMELGQVQSAINHALTFNSGGFIEIQVRSDDQQVSRRKLRSSCTALDDTIMVQNVDEQQQGGGGSQKIFMSNSLGSTLPSDLDLYVPVYAANCKMIANQMSDDEKWQKLSKVRGSTVVSESQDIPKPMSMISLSHPPLDDVAMKDRTKGIFINPPEGRKMNLFTGTYLIINSVYSRQEQVGAGHGYLLQRQRIQSSGLWNRGRF